LLKKASVPAFASNSEQRHCTIQSMTKSTNLITDGLWVAGGQALAALGVLVGVRLQTELIPPEVYGEAVLFSGLSTLALTIICVPYWRGATLFYGEAATYGLEEALFCFVRKSVAKYLGWTITCLLGFGLLYRAITGSSSWAIITLSALLAIDAARSVEMAFLNAKRQQRQYALWNILEAWSRPLCAVIAVWYFAAKVEVILAGYMVGSMVVFALFHQWTIKPVGDYSEEEFKKIEDLNKRVVKYSVPLMPQGLVGWLSALSDRYMLAAIVGLHESGLYSAIFGLISRPFLMAQSVSELTIRPVYFQTVATHDQQKEAAILKQWILVNCAIGTALLAVCIVGSNIITGYLLGPAYSGGADLIPYLAVAHLFLIVGYGLNGYLYAHEYTKELFWFDGLAVALSLILGPFAMRSAGTLGAAMTCVIVYMARTIAIAIFVNRKRKSTLSQPPVG